MAANPLQTQSPTETQKALKACRVAFGWLLVFSFFYNVLVLTTPLYMLQVYDRVLASGKVETLIALTVIAGVAVLVLGILEAVRGWMAGRLGDWLDRRLGERVIRASLRGTLDGEILGAAPLRDLATLRTFMSGTLKTVLDAPWAPIFFVAMFVLHTWLGLLAITVGALLLIVTAVNNAVTARPYETSTAAAAAAQLNVDVSLRNAEALNAMGMIGQLVGRWGQSQEAVLRAQQAANDRVSALTGLSRFIRMFAQIAVLGLGAYLVIRGEMTAGTMIAGSIIMGRALQPIEQSITSWKGIVGARGAYRRLNRVEGLDPVRASSTQLPAPQGRLTGKDLFYAPKNAPPILKSVSFAVPPGEALGIIGHSGAGKTTLCKLIIGSTQPSHGTVAVDGAALSQWDVEFLGQFVGYLPQDVELFAGTIRDNIARLDPGADDALVIEAAKAAGAHEMIVRLPKGYDSEIGPGGAYLSGGQRQRIGLARAFYRRPVIVVLDEPNAHLDTAGEEALVKAIAAAKAWGAAVVVVGHSPNLLMPVDRLMILREGEVEHYGPKELVLAHLREAQQRTERAKLALTQARADTEETAEDGTQDPPSSETASGAGDPMAKGGTA